MKKTIQICGILLALALLLAPAAMAAEGKGAVAVYVNGFRMDLERPALAGGGVTLVPAEEFCQKLGGTAASSPADGTPFPEHVQARWAEDGSNTLAVAAGEHTVALPAELVDGVAYVPLRPLAEGLGLTVAWDGAVRISSPKKRVEVDSLAGLFNAVGSHTEIVLAAGAYSFGDLDPTQIDNPHVLAYTGVDGRDILFRGCTFSANRLGEVFTYGWQASGGAVFEDCTLLDPPSA